MTVSQGMTSTRGNPSAAVSDSGGQSIRRPLLVSLGVHVLFFILSLFGVFEVNDWENAEWSMDVELASDFDVSNSKESALPNAKIAEEAAVHKQVLPQLPQRYQVEANAPEQSEAIHEVEEQKPAEQVTPEEEKPADAPVPPKVDDEATKVQAAELLKRKALEQLRLEKKFSDTVEAQKSDALSKLKNDSAVDNSNLASDSMLSGVARDKYRQVVHQAILPHYQLPDAYNLTNKDLVSVAEIEIDRAGNVIKAETHESSGDSVFDQLVLDIVQKASPLPRPPLGFEGKFLMRFNPGSLK